MGDASEANIAKSDSQQPNPVAVGLSSYPPGTAAPPMPSSSAVQHQQQQQQIYGVLQNAFSSQFDMTQARGSNPYNMNAMANALPQGGYRQPYPQGAGPQPRYNTGIPIPQPHQYAVHGVPMPNQQYYLPQHPGMPPYYPVAVSQSPPNPQARQNVGYYQGQMANHAGGGQGNAPYYFPPASPYSMVNQQGVPAQYGRPPGQDDTRMPPQGDATDGMPLSAGYKSWMKRNKANGKLKSNDEAAESMDDRQGGVRGPPRKPRQSGHAIWIGNLPPQTDLMNLVHHVCKEAPGLESLFLISKSNCAFANFKDELTCVAAQQKLHDSRFQSVRLVSRLRKSTVEGSTGVTAPTGPAAAAAASPTSTPAPAETLEESGKSSPAPGQPRGSSRTPGADGATGKDKFFILKSLTVEDLDLSVRNGTWATQSHNEDALNKAFKTADNVYLVFSANKSGEYFGYARMTSEINDDPAAAIEFAPAAQPTIDIDLPKAIPTESTEFAPKGRIIDDSARGTIFWEVERDGVDDEESVDDEEGSKSGEQDGDVDGEAGPKAWGKPFKLEWLSTTKLPFYRTRGLRNPWNSNREVKIARDGTELEPNVGRRLVSLFNRVHSPDIVQAAIRPGMGGTMIYPPMRPFHQ